MGYHAIFKVLFTPYTNFSRQIASRRVGRDMSKTTNVSMELLSEILTWLIRDLNKMHYHKKNYFQGGGVSESPKIQPQTID